ncbi:helix-turn-helix domain-containing protein [Streptomyces venezuelae]|uniref:helix-turn-helix domain-containing protein n=1 Tax=Streptomyces venezuelae TaxID=54571 RepID=UPI001681CBD5|nr:LuxR C-terminal-related transcriptional regulator [Streptomyces venezuelae]
MKPTLTARELKVLELIATGFTYAEIAEQLSIGVDGAKGAASRMMMRLGALNAPHAVYLATQAGILKRRRGRPSGPPRQPLTARQAQVLTTAADGASLTVVARRLNSTREQVAARLAEAYLRLGVTHLPRGQRRTAAVTVARKRGLIPNPAKETA